MSEYTMDEIMHPESHLTLRECLSNLQQQIEKMRKEMANMRYEINQLKRLTE